MRFFRAPLLGVSLLGAAAMASFSQAVAAQQAPAIIGRWDLTCQCTWGAGPAWLEVTKSGRATLIGRFVASGGSARPIAKVEFDGRTVRFAIPPQWEADTGTFRFEGTLENDKLTGTWRMNNDASTPFTGVRAPTLRRTAAPAWDAPQALFDGKDMTQWEPLPGNNRWAVVNGILTNRASGANLRTKATFTDFKLHVEFRYPRGGNSGVYLRGRHEVQIEDSGTGEPESIHLGGIYGFLTPNENAAKGPGEWQTFDITLIGRRVTVVLNGKTIIADQTIPGITGGALDSDEGAPGPLYLQGDHTAVEFRSIIITPAKAAR